MGCKYKGHIFVNGKRFDCDGDISTTTIILNVLCALMFLVVIIVMTGCIGNNINVAGSQEAWKKIGVAEDIGKGNQAEIGKSEKKKTVIKGDVTNEKDSNDSAVIDSFVDPFKLELGI